MIQANGSSTSFGFTKIASTDTERKATIPTGALGPTGPLGPTGALGPTGTDPTDTKKEKKLIPPSFVLGHILYEMQMFLQTYSLLNSSSPKYNIYYVAHFTSIRNLLYFFREESKDFSDMLYNNFYLSDTDDYESIIRLYNSKSLPHLIEKEDLSLDKETTKNALASICKTVSHLTNDRFLGKPTKSETWLNCNYLNIIQHLIETINIFIKALKEVSDKRIYYIYSKSKKSDKKLPKNISDEMKDENVINLISKIKEQIEDIK